MITWPCFWCEPTDRARVSLRRYAEGDCPTHPTRGIHNADVVVGEEPFDSPYNGRGVQVEPDGDPRWPERCACGHGFAVDDTWQRNLNRLYRRTDTGETFTLREAPTGAMWDVSWMDDAWGGPDGRVLCVKLPDGSEWMVDGPAANAPGKLPGWDRTGEPPLVTARPSIDSQGYHGWLTDGVLSADLEGRAYP